MKYILLISVAAISFSSCKKILQEEIVNEIIEEEISSAKISSIPNPPKAYQWAQLTVPSQGNTYPYNDPKEPVIIINTANDVYALSGECLEVPFKLNKSTKKWERQTAYPANFCLFGLSKHLFTYQSKAYVGLKSSDPTGFKAFDPATGTVTNMANFPGGLENKIPVSFVLGDKGYVFLEGPFPSIWEYNFSTNLWTNKGNKPLPNRHSAVVFVANGKAYIGLGWETATLNGQSFRLYKKDWIQFTPGSAYAAVKANFPGIAREGGNGFVIDNNIYLGFGLNNTASNPSPLPQLKDFWKYNTANNTWTRQADYPGFWIIGLADNVKNIGSFSVGSTGYIVTGALNEFYRFSNSLFYP